MKETLAYNVLTVIQEFAQSSLNAVCRGNRFERLYYHYDGIGKRLSDLKKYGLVESKGDDHNGYMLYQVSEKGLCVKSFDDYKKATYKPRTPKPKKTREESAVKKACKEVSMENGASAYYRPNGSVSVGPSSEKKECDDIMIYSYHDSDTMKEGEYIHMTEEEFMSGSKEKGVLYTNAKEGDEPMIMKPMPYDGPATSGYLRIEEATKEDLLDRHNTKIERMRTGTLSIEDKISLGEGDSIECDCRSQPKPRYKRLRSAFTRA